MTRAILTQAQRLSTMLTKVVQTKGKLDALGRGIVPTKPSDDFVYEVYVDLRVLFELRKSWTIEMRNHSAHTLRFPRKPAHKSTFPYFAAVDAQGQELFQICFGTEYADIAGVETFAPDISFQIAGAPLGPDATHVAFCIDQKYTSADVSNQANRLDRNEIFALRGQLADLFKPGGTLPAVFINSSVFVDRNSIVTNANESTLSPQALTTVGIAEISLFAPGQPGKRRG
jgi:hypothetical protein